MMINNMTELFILFFLCNFFITARLGFSSHLIEAGKWFGEIAYKNGQN